MKLDYTKTLIEIYEEVMNRLKPDTKGIFGCYSTRLPREKLIQYISHHDSQQSTSTQQDLKDFKSALSAQEDSTRGRYLLLDPASIKLGQS